MVTVVTKGFQGSNLIQMKLLHWLHFVCLSTARDPELLFLPKSSLLESGQILKQCDSLFFLLSIHSLATHEGPKPFGTAKDEIKHRCRS